MNTIVALPIVAALPVAAPAMVPAIDAGQSDDPIFAAIDMHRQAACDAVPRGVDIPNDLGDRCGDAFRAVMRTCPTPPAGLVALTTWARQEADRLRKEGYYEAQAVWSPALAKAHAKVECKFGEPPYLDPEKGRRVQKAFEQACGEMGVDDASEKMEAIVKEIKRLSKVIHMLPVTSLEGLRAKALVAFWENAPLCAGDTEYDFSDEVVHQRLFVAVVQACGLADRVADKGYVLPHSQFDEDEDESEDAWRSRFVQNDDERVPKMTNGRQQIPCVDRPTSSWCMTTQRNSRLPAADCGTCRTDEAIVDIYPARQRSHVGAQGPRSRRK